MRLAYRPPLARAELLAFLRARAIPGVEHVDGAGYRRAVLRDGGPALLALVFHAGEPAVELTVGRSGGPPVGQSRRVTSTGDAEPFVGPCRRLLDLDADPVAIDDVLAGDPVLGPLVAATPGFRLPGAFDGWATTILAVLAQGVSLASARAAAGRIAGAFGRAVDVGDPAITRLFPEPATLAGADLSRVGLPGRSSRTVLALAAEVAAGRVDLDGAAGPEATIASLIAVPGIGRWTCGYVAMRVLGDRDAFLPGDAAVRRAFRTRGLPADDGSIARAAEAWRPWRGYATVRLWSAPGGTTERRGTSERGRTTEDGASD